MPKLFKIAAIVAGIIGVAGLAAAITAFAIIWAAADNIRTTLLTEEQTRVENVIGGRFIDKDDELLPGLPMGDPGQDWIALPPGMRAVSFPIWKMRIDGGRLTGCRADIYWTDRKRDANDRPVEKKVLLQNVLILAQDFDTGVVTAALSDDDARKIMSALETGDFTIFLSDFDEPVAEQMRLSDFIKDAEK